MTENMKCVAPVAAATRSDKVPAECTIVIAQLMSEGIEHHRAQRFVEAVDRYSRVVELLPLYGEAWRLLGVVALQTGYNDAARSMLERAINIDVNDAVAHSSLGGVNEAEGKLDEAYAAYGSAFRLDAMLDAAVVGLMRTALALGRAQEAVAIGEAGVERGVSDAGLLRALGAARLQLRDYAGGADALLASLRIEPHADAYANLGAAFVHLHRVDEAIAACDSALALNPSHADAANNLGIAYKAKAAFPAALAAFERAGALGSEESHINLGTTLLLLGDNRNGWPQYGWANPERRANPAFSALPMWDGRPCPGQRLLIWPEQGIGDTIQMVRFLQRAHGLVGSITLACPLELVDLMRGVAGVDACVDIRECPPLDTFNVWLPTIRLPVVFDITSESIPVTPYLWADAARMGRFRPLVARGGQLLAGLVWSGNPDFAWNDLRSCALAEFEPLNDVAGVTWFALQQGIARTQRAPNTMQLVTINTAVSDFADTAAIISQLDLVITVDTSAAHLTGALGRPAWVLLSSRPDWRWQLAGEGTPWYPTLRLFRQSEEGAWAPVVAKLVESLRELVAVRS